MRETTETAWWLFVASVWFGIGLSLLLWALRQLRNQFVKADKHVKVMLDTSQKSKEIVQKMEGNTTYCYPQDEGPLTRICPLCGALYPSFKVICEEDDHILQSFRKPITEPLQATAKRNDLAQEIDEAEKLFEKELDKIRYELEEKAYYYNRRRPYTFTEQETLSIYNLYTRVREQSHEEYRAS